MGQYYSYATVEARCGIIRILCIVSIDRCYVSRTQVSTCTIAIYYYSA